MSRGFPSTTALLGLLAIAGYQNRDKLADLLGGLGRGAPTAPGQPGASSTGLGGLLDQLRGSLSGASAGSILSGGLSELLDRFKQTGHGDTADLCGLGRVQTNSSRPPNLSRRSALRSWRRCPNRPGYRGKNC